MFPTKCILVATDLTTRCEPALRAASDLAVSSGATLHILHAFELHGNSYVEHAEARTAFQALVQEARDGLREQIRLTISPHAKIGSVITELYLPWKSIVRHARDLNAELIVTGPHDHVIGDRFLGATSDRVVRFAAVPTLVVRRGTDFDVSRIVAAIDGSAGTSSAWAEAISWCEEFARVRPCELHFILSASDWIERVAGNELIQGALLEARDHLRGSQVTVYGDVIVGTDAVDDIVSYVDRVGADLLVMATSGHGAVDRIVTGSVTSEVTPLASCAVLVVPVPEPAEALSMSELLKWQLPLATV